MNKSHFFLFVFLFLQATKLQAMDDSFAFQGHIKVHTDQESQDKLYDINFKLWVSKQYITNNTSRLLKELRKQKDTFQQDPFFSDNHDNHTTFDLVYEEWLEELAQRCHNHELNKENLNSSQNNRPTENRMALDYILNPKEN